MTTASGWIRNIFKSIQTLLNSDVMAVDARVMYVLSFVLLSTVYVSISRRDVTVTLLASLMQTRYLYNSRKKIYF